MQKLLGGIVLVAGVGVVGWYGCTFNAKAMQAAITANARGATQATIHPINTRISGRDIIVSGIANDEIERDMILSSLNDVTGRRVVRDDLHVLETVKPFVFDAAKNADVIVYDGVVPTEVDREVLSSRIGDAAEVLELKAGSPDENWTRVVLEGLDSLDVLQDGMLSVSDQTVTITGTALTPNHDAAARSALAELPSGYEANFDINLLDDGTPQRLTIDLAESGDATVSGKVPEAFDVSVLASIFSGEIQTDVHHSIIPAPVSDWANVSMVGAAALAKLRVGQLQMTEETLSVTGFATPEAKAEAEAVLAGIPEGFPTTSEIELYDDGVPFTLEMTRDSSGVVAEGKFPAEVAALDVIGDISGDAIRNAYISDGTNRFADVARRGVQALGELETGHLSVVGTEVILRGTALSTAEADTATGLLSELPAGYTATFDIVARDDGTPPDFDVIYDAGTGASVAGKLPAGTDVNTIAGALDLGSVRGTPLQGLIGNGSQATDQLAVVANWLPELETMTFQSTEETITIDAVTAPGVNQELVAAGLAEALGAGVNLSVTGSTVVPDEGTERVNQATGRSEAFTAGYWLPVAAFSANIENCNAGSVAVLAADRIGFVTGSSQLDAQSVRAINAVASVVRLCAAETDLIVEVGGHTDSQGGEDLNLGLSQSRAEAVQAALVARGVPERDITAKGYGEAKPIADNDTVDGRAANRRTTIVWSEPAIETPLVNDETNTEVGE